MTEQLLETALKLPSDGQDPKAELPWLNRFARLGESFYTLQPPRALPDPYWVSLNTSLANELALPKGFLTTDEALQALAGNAVLRGSEPLASVYSGHQFGQWAGQLGDGRALLLGELQTPQGGIEIQLKGAGLTPYSRMGDGRAVLRSSIREYLCSEAMHALGIPTTRALCIAGSDARVRREEIETAAVVTRTSPSFIRFGHFEHFSYAGQHGELKTLADFVIDHFYPDCRSAPQPYAALLQAVSERTARMVAAWQAVGFCHGVMNTDNMSILGLTIDYGPFQFLDAFNPGHVCNHSDTQGRYAYNKQANIAYWNLFCLGQALLPLVEEQADALAALESYKTVFPDELQGRMRAKLGLLDAQADDKLLIEDIFKRLAADQVDYTIFWRRLCHFTSPEGREAVRDLFLDRAAFDVWAERYGARLGTQDTIESQKLMLRTNPKFVLRNHLGEQAIRAAKEKNFTEVDTLLALLQAPYDEHSAHETHAGFPPAWASGIEISCSS